MIHYGNVLAGRDGRVWLMPQCDKLGTVRRAGSGWKSECNSGDWVSLIHRTRRDAINDLIDHWNDQGAFDFQTEWRYRVSVDATDGRTSVVLDETSPEQTTERYDEQLAVWSERRRADRTNRSEETR